MPLTTKAPIHSAPPPRAPDNARGILLIASGFFLFSIVDAAAKFLTGSSHPVQIVWTRQLGLLLGVVLFLALRGPGFLRTAAPGLQVARGAVAALSATLFVFAVKYAPLAEAVAVSFVAPFMVTILGAVVLREPVGMRRWIAVAIGFGGMLMVVRPGSAGVHPALLLVVLAAGLFALRQVISRLLAGREGLATTVAYTSLTSSLLLTIPLPFVWQAPAGWFEIGLLAGMAVMAGLADFLVIKALDIAHAVALAPLHYTLLLWGTFYGWLIFGQLPDGWTWIGAGIIMATGLYTLHRERLAARRR